MQVLALDAQIELSEAFAILKLRCVNVLVRINRFINRLLGVWLRTLIPYLLIAYLLYDHVLFLLHLSLQVSVAVFRREVIVLLFFTRVVDRISHARLQALLRGIRRWRLIIHNYSVQGYRRQLAEALVMVIRRGSRCTFLVFAFLAAQMLTFAYDPLLRELSLTIEAITNLSRLLVVQWLVNQTTLTMAKIVKAICTASVILRKIFFFRWLSRCVWGNLRNITHSATFLLLQIGICNYLCFNLFRWMRQCLILRRLLKHWLGLRRHCCHLLGR